MEKEMIISEKKLEKLAKRLSKEFGIGMDEAYELIYEEWEMIEELFAVHQKTKAVKEHLVRRMNELYRIA